MNETKMWRKLKPTFDGLGTATRIENTATSGMPDVLLVSGGVFVFLELKVLRSPNKIVCPPFQWSYAKRVSHHLRTHNHWYVVATTNNKPMMMFTFSQFKKIEPVYNMGKLEISLDGIQPPFLLHKPADLREWMKFVEDKEYG